MPSEAPHAASVLIALARRPLLGPFVLSLLVPLLRAPAASQACNVACRAALALCGVAGKPGTLPAILASGAPEALLGLLGAAAAGRGGGAGGRTAEGHAAGAACAALLRLAAHPPCKVGGGGGGRRGGSEGVPCALL